MYSLDDIKTTRHAKLCYLAGFCYQLIDKLSLSKPSSVCGSKGSSIPCHALVIGGLLIQAKQAGIYLDANKFAKNPDGSTEMHVEDYKSFIQSKMQLRLYCYHNCTDRLEFNKRMEEELYNFPLPGNQAAHFSSSKFRSERCP